jgi:hypothetical protein
MGWSTLVNGVLADAAERAGFEDHYRGQKFSLSGQYQFPKSYGDYSLDKSLADPSRVALRPILQVLQAARPGSYHQVAVGRFRRGRSGPPKSAIQGKPCFSRSRPGDWPRRTRTPSTIG